MITKKTLVKLYVTQQLSMQEIAQQLHCSVHQVQYWMQRYGISRRSMSDAIYIKHHPSGDPFHFRKPRTANEIFLFGLGIGLYWGEGTKANLASVRLGNTDPNLLNTFLKFMEKFFAVKRRDFRFGLQLFSDMNVKKALDFWRKKLKIRQNQFYKVTVTKTGSIGTYRKKSLYGVLTVYYNNKKLRDLLVSLLPP